jgi:hypothetical protein
MAIFKCIINKFHLRREEKIMSSTLTPHFGELKIDIIVNTNKEWYYGRRMRRITAKAATEAAATTLLEKLQGELTGERFKVTRHKNVVTIVIATYSAPRVRGYLKSNSPDLLAALVNDGWL